MKTIIIFFLLMWAVPGVWGQTAVKYEYDAAGNRKLRKVITLPNQASIIKSAVTDDGQQTENTENVALDQRGATFVDILGERKVVIYPNPTRGMIRIEFQGYPDMSGAQLSLYNVQGRLLKKLSKVEPSNTLDLSVYPAGMYILLMTEGKEKSEWKIVKE